MVEEPLVPPPPPPGETPSGPESPGKPSEPNLQAAVTKSRERRQALLRHRQTRRTSTTPEWVFVLVALAAALAWLFGRDACTRTISNTYGTLAGVRDGGPRGATPGAQAGRDAGGDEDW
jgi:hypothetical protein